MRKRLLQEIRALLGRKPAQRIGRAEAAHDQRRDLRPHAPDRLERAHAIQPRHRKIQYNRKKRLGRRREFIHRFPAVHRDDDLIPLPAQHRHDRADERGLVIREQNFSAGRD